MNVNSYKVGDRVWGVDAAGRRFEGAVTRVYAYSVELDGRVHAPLSLIKGRVG